MAQDEALPFLRQNAPDKPDGVLRAAYLRAGGFLGQALTLLQDAEDEPFVRQFAAAYAAHDRMALLRVLLPMEKAKREQLLPALQQLRACICGALTQRGGLDTASESAASPAAPAQSFCRRPTAFRLPLTRWPPMRRQAQSPAILR